MGQHGEPLSGERNSPGTSTPVEEGDSLEDQWKQEYAKDELLGDRLQ